MSKLTTIAVTTFATVLLASVAMRVIVSAQEGQEGGRAGGGPEQAEPAVPSQNMVVVKTRTRVYDKAKLLTAPALSEAAYTGRVLWQQRCAYCHDGVGQPSYKTMGPWMDSDTVKQLGADTMITITKTGTTRMPGFQYNLTDKQLNDVIEFLKTVPPSEKPTESQLAGKASGPDGSD